MSTLTILSAGPALSVQDQGRPGYLARGLTCGGAIDRLALAEGAALLRQSDTLAALEMGGMGGQFSFDADTRVALTGAPMPTTCDGETLAWNASHLIPAGATLAIGVAARGSYGYLHVGGGLDTPEILGARAAHLSAGIGALLASGDTLPIGPDKGRETGLTLPLDQRFEGGTLRAVTSMQTDRFDAATLKRFTATEFKRDPRANRMGVRLDPCGEGFEAEGGLNILSDVIVPGDIQVAGDGAPFVLMADCQTTGGYPRIGCVIPADMPRVAQAASGAPLRITFIPLDEAREIEARAARDRTALRALCTPLLRDPHDIRDLLGYQLISGAVSATANPFEETAP
ncbi:biotin-dependent carboxyltransferase family protein [Sulfitobacter albidus]|uniref:Biotin-dependent carboxyltransferase family protein n=1 Tax=Sulfitobacter albidus TaxID=2829501 RepID=A0A975JCJ7_9RHOB|nr:biotin-dependent carboxyltransferase family protein [Sulfitobacter albidus]QUJ75989.1 biotin-dependent carboxyltransferase family protein [Sulfitobacter albidus]